MDEKQLINFLAEVHTELKRRRRANVKKRPEVTPSQDRQANKPIPRSYKFETTVEFDPIAAAAIGLAQLQCERFTDNETDRKVLFAAFVDSFCLGRMREIQVIDATHVQRAVRATNGRRLIGASSRAKVAKAAESLKHLSKEKAAAAMSSHVNLDPGTIRRYLSELFPGEKWKH